MKSLKFAPARPTQAPRRGGPRAGTGPRALFRRRYERGELRSAIAGADLGCRLRRLQGKTLLLLAMLHELGIEAEPVLASIGQGDLVAMRVPAPAAFNHIFVHARIAGEDLWLDGTGRGSRLEDMGDAPPFRSVLPVTEAGANLMQLPWNAPARPTRTVALDVDESAAIGVPVHSRRRSRCGARPPMRCARSSRSWTTKSCCSSR